MRKFIKICLPPCLVIVAAVLLPLASCTTNTSSTQSQFYNAGDANLSITGAQFDQYYLVRFDTSVAPHT
jgi:hypothetical protein